MRARRIGSTLSKPIIAGPSVPKMEIIEGAGVATMTRFITVGDSRSEGVNQV